MKYLWYHKVNLSINTASRRPQGNYWNCTNNNGRLCVYDVMDETNNFEILSHGVCVPKGTCAGAGGRGHWGEPMNQLIKFGVHTGCRAMLWSNCWKP